MSNDPQTKELREVIEEARLMMMPPAEGPLSQQPKPRGEGRHCSSWAAKAWKPQSAPLPSDGAQSMVVTCPKLYNSISENSTLGSPDFSCSAPCIRNGSVCICLREYWKGMNVSKLSNMPESLFKRSFWEIIFRSSSKGKILTIWGSRKIIPKN